MTLLSMSSHSSVHRAPAWFLGGHGFDSLPGLGIFSLSHARVMLIKFTFNKFHLPVNARKQNMFSNDVKRLEFQVSNFEVFPPKCDVLMRILAQLLEKNLYKFFHLIPQIA